jgi:hypothetical protein
MKPRVVSPVYESKTVIIHIEAVDSLIEMTKITFLSSGPDIMSPGKIQNSGVVLCIMDFQSQLRSGLHQLAERL